MDLNKFVGKPYRLGGRGPEFYDCWGLVMAVFEQRGITLPDWRSNSSELSDIVSAVTHGIYESADKHYVIEVTYPRDFDIAVVSRAHKAHHVGVFYAQGILHSSSNKMGVTHDSPLMFMKTGTGVLTYYRWLDDTIDLS